MDRAGKMEAKLKHCETFIRKFAEEAVWTRKMKNLPCTRGPMRLVK